MGNTLSRVLGKQKLHGYLLFLDILSETETVINCRPLMHLSDDPHIAKHDHIILTPFLLLEGRQYIQFYLDLASFTEAVTPLTWNLKKKFKTRNDIRNKLERVYYLEYFNEMWL